MVLAIELLTSHLLGKCATTWATPQVSGPKILKVNKTQMTSG
jgi:hypothetical protein